MHQLLVAQHCVLLPARQGSFLSQEITTHLFPRICSPISLCATCVVPLPTSSARGVELNEARLRMAALPTPTDDVLYTPGLWVPLVVVDQVHILPGIPRLFQAMVLAHQVGVGPCLTLVLQNE